MSLTGQQKKYIKKHIKEQSSAEIAEFLDLTEVEVLNYLKKRWKQEKVNKFLNITEISYEYKGLSRLVTDCKTFLFSHWPFLLLLTILTIAVYANSLANAFLSDDLPEIVHNPNVGNLGYAVSSHPFGFIRLLFYWAAFHIGGLNPIIFRLINVLLHLGNVFLLYTLVVSIMRSKKVAFFSAALFAIHPLLVEPVIWISGGSYPQYTFFFLLSLLLYIKSANSIKLYLLSLFSYLLSFMSHPVMPSSLLLVYPLYEFIFGRLRKNWLRVVPFALIVVVYVFVNAASLPERENTLQAVHYQERGVDNIFVLVPVAVTSYLNLLFWPQDLTLYHSELAFGQTAFIIFLLEFLAFLAILGLIFKKNRKIFFWSSLFLISLLPTLTPLRLNWVVAERYVYLGSIGIFVSGVYFLDRLIAKIKLKTLFYSVLIIILALLFIRTILRNTDWKNEDNLWIATGKTSPSSPNTHNNLGDVYGRQGNKEKAIEEFKKAIEIKPNYADAYHNLGNSYHDLRRDDLALENYRKASEYNPKLWQSYQNMAAIYFERKDIKNALINIQKAAQVNPGSLQIQNNLGLVYLAAGQKDNAKEAFRRVLTADPKNQFAQKGLDEVAKLK